MNIAIGRHAIAALLFSFAIVPASAQDDPKTASFQRQEGYEQASFGGQEVTIRTRDGGSRRLRISFSKLRVAETGKQVAIKLPASGLALVQHAAGDAKVVAGRERFAPLEGEWLRLALPTQLAAGTDDDSILMDLILIEDADAVR